MINKQGDGSVRRTKAGTYECIVQSKEINPKTGKEFRVKRTRATREEAEKAAKLALKAELKKLKDATDYKQSNTMTFGEYCEDYLIKKVKNKGKVTQGTYHDYKRSYNQYVKKYTIAKRQAHQLSKREFEIYYERLSSVYAPATIKFPVQLCRRVCDWLVERKLIEENYADQAEVVYEKIEEAIFVDKRNHKEIFTEEDVKKFYEAYLLDLSENALIAVFILETGVRPQEFANLKNSDISLEEKKMIVCASSERVFTDETETSTVVHERDMTKTNDFREVFLSDTACEVIEKMQKKTKIYCKCNYKDYLFPTFRNGHARSNATMENGLKALCEKLDIDRDVHPTKSGQMIGLNVYALRHTCNTMMQVNGANPVITASMLGHSPTTALRHYTHVTVDAQREKLKTPMTILAEKEKSSDTITATDTSPIIIDTNLLRKNLEDLQKMYNDGLITEENYQKLQQKLLGI